MKKSRVFLDNQNQPQSKRLVLMAKEKKRLVDFFSILVEIDQRINITRAYEKPTN
tara:strand:+ start:192 stop:356 length:165 start_codon:yes stop_codon:yes gene_type:complete